MCNLAKKFKKFENYFEQIYIDYKIAFYIYYIISLTYFYLFLLLYFLVPVFSSKNDINFLNEIINDFNKPLFTSIWIGNFKNFLENEELITFGTWHGTNDGCFCKEGILNEECDENQKKLNCYNIKPVYPKTFLQYRGNYFIKYWSGNKTTYYDILKDNSSYIIVENKEDCPEDYRQSGIFDSFKNKLCRRLIVGHSVINGIIISNQKEIKNYSLVDKQLDENKYFHYTKENINGDIISDLFIFKEQPCYYSQEYNWETFSELEEGKGYGCKANNGAKDDRYKFIDSYNQYKFYYTNDILDYSYLKYMKEEDKQRLNNSIVSLYYRNFIGFNHSCLKKKNIYDVKNEFVELQYTAEEPRLFFSRLSKDIDHFIIKQFGAINLIFQFYINFFFFRVDKFRKPTNFFNIIYYLNIPEILAYCSFIYNFMKIKKRKRSVTEIIDNMYECCDEFTKYGLDLLKQKDTMKNYYKYPIIFKLFYLTSFIIFMLLIIFVIIIILIFIIIFIFVIFNCSETNEHTSLIEESHNRDNSNNNQQEANNQEIANRRYENI